MREFAVEVGVFGPVCADDVVFLVGVRVVLSNFGLILKVVRTVLVTLVTCVVLFVVVGVVFWIWIDLSRV